MAFLHGPPEKRGSEMSVVGQGTLSGHLSDDVVARVVDEGLGKLPLDGRRVLVIIPDGTRTMPMPFMFDAIERALGPRVQALDFLVALGTHAPMSDAALSTHVGRPVVERAGRRATHIQSPVGRPVNIPESGIDPGQRGLRADGRASVASRFRWL